MATKDINGKWMNSGGNFIPANRIPKIFKLRDATVIKILKRMSKLEAMMKKIKADNFADVDAYLKKLAISSGLKNKTIAGNITLSSYDNLNRIELSINHIEGFDEQLNAAKTLIDECIIGWSKDSNKNLKIVIDEAFKLDSQKRFNTNAVWSLTKLDIKDQKWQKAMELVKNSRQKYESRQYMRIAKRKSHKGLFKNVNLNFSAIDIEE
jgi:hypothetical protein